ncbi:AAA domain-containing protein [Hymenobacter sp. DG25B]|uniref:AAA domain-containing protein n=1 Tax=Hymenobacter sp. DG25B TaxID=1385664 RepID=UPI0005C9EC1A|nr:AAA domain-containing protein [Hymenobacter sp. DG25B]
MLSVEQERLLALLAYTQESVRLRSAPAADVTRQPHFHALEAQLSGLPGVELNLAANSPEAEEEVWLRIERLRERPAPPILEEPLATLIDFTNDPGSRPELRRALPASTLRRLGLLPEDASPEPAYDPLAPIETSTLAQFPGLAVALEQYIRQQWQPWALEENQRRRTMAWYSRLYTLKQQLDGGLTDSPLELVWGVGMAVWHLNGTAVCYPLLTRLVELTLNPQSMALEIRPRDVVTRLEVEIYAAQNVGGVAELERGSRPFLTESPYLSPFDPDTYKPILELAAGFLDEQGHFLFDKNQARLLPTATAALQITDTWVLFARPRTSNAFLQDLEALRGQVEQAPQGLPEAAAALVREPADYHANRPLPAFRGLSMVGGSTENPDSPPQELYFPLPFNDEQVRIVQMLEHAPGVVVQGPPGTGKTHTIANVICHYLALGKRVLVTSMKDPALAVLRDKLPAAVRPLAISLLTSEREGMQQFEYAIQRIGEEVQRLDPATSTRQIEQLAAQLDACHAQMADIDRLVTQWGQQNLQPLDLDGEMLTARDIAREVVQSGTLANWLTDDLETDPAHAPQFTEAEINALRTARRTLQADLEYRTAQLPALEALPDIRELLLTHQQLSRATELQKAVALGQVPPLAALPDMPDQLSAVLAMLTSVQEQRQQIAAITWGISQQEQLKQGRKVPLYALLEALGAELRTALQARQQFLPRPVSVPAGIELNEELVEAIQAQAQGQRPFGLAGWFGKTAQKQQLAEIRVMATAPATAADWAYVDNYLKVLRTLCALAARWNALAAELSLPVLVADQPIAAAAEAGQRYEEYELLRDVQQLEDELNTSLQRVLPSWPPAGKIFPLEEARKILQLHQDRLQLETTWTVREQYERALHGATGAISEELRQFMAHTLGNPAVTDEAMQAQWAALTQELRRIHALQSELATVTNLTSQIAASGALRWAARLQHEPANGTLDELLPADWSVRWRLRRLARYLSGLDHRAEIKQLAADRVETEAALARTYQDIITQKTWLQLALKATPLVRSALQAYRSAITRVGKGTGKSAGKHRQAAREAAQVANSAIPCWIMPHYRVSESLPAELGAFDLVIVDEASQSNLLALPALLRARKILIVGDDKQVGPGRSGLTEEKENELMSRFLATQPALYRPQLSPSHSIYQLFQVVFSDSQVPLQEHFRSVGPIIEYSKREFYHHSLRPLRLPKASERLDPPLVDVLVEDGARQGDINPGEARFIVEEIRRLTQDPAMQQRSIGVVSLLADKQAKLIWEMLEQEIGLETMLRHQLACGNAHTFQGKERDIMFLSLVVSPGQATAMGQTEDARRFNVAASRARDRMYLVRSIELEDLSPADQLRRNLLAHFTAPYAQDEQCVNNLRALCESPFEQEVYDMLTTRGYRVQPQVRVGHYRIDLVVEGENDQRLAVECDGDQYHGPDRWQDDLRRQRVLERAGWQFWRCFASAWVRWRQETEQDLLDTLTRAGIRPVSATAVPGRHTESRRYVAFPAQEAEAASAFEMSGPPRPA